MNKHTQDKQDANVAYNIDKSILLEYIGGTALKRAVGSSKNTTGKFKPAKSAPNLTLSKRSI